MRRLLLGLACATLLLPACGDDDDDDRAAVTSIPERATSSTSTTTTTTEPPVPPPDVIPADESQITEQYVEQVLNALYEVSLEAILILRDEGVVEERVLALVAATYSDDAFNQQVNDLMDLTFSGDLTGVRLEPEALRASVMNILEATRSCVVAEVRTDASALLVTSPEPEANQRDFVRLLPADNSQTSSGLNPTAWVIDQFPVTLDGSVPTLRCD
jgi:major membrane immunogen (membrane-anchored lipoprotein)